MKFLIVGANGQLGSEYLRQCKELRYKSIGLTHQNIEISDINKTYDVLDKYDFDVIINTAAYHAKKAYADTNPNKFYEVNVFGPYYLAKYAAERNKILIHFSTDYVFSGNEVDNNYSFVEEDLPLPANLYAASKLAGENIIRTICEKHLIFRVASIYGVNGCRAKDEGNFPLMVINKLSKNENMTIVDDIIMSPTSTKSIVLKSIEILNSNSFGLFHLAGSGKATWFEFALKIAEYYNLPKELLLKSNTTNYKQEIRRGKNTSLKNNNLIKEGFSDLPSWQESLFEFINEYKTLIKEKEKL